MGRSIGAVLLGIIVAIVLLSILELGLGALHGPPAGVDLSDPLQMKAYVASMPTSAVLLLLAAYLVSGIAGGGAAARVARRLAAFHGLMVGILFALAGLMNILMIPHPFWIAAGSLLAQLAGPVIGARIAGATGASV